MPFGRWEAKNGHSALTCLCSEFTAQVDAEASDRAGSSESHPPPTGNSHINNQTDPSVCSNPAETDRNGTKRRRVHVCCCSGFPALLHQYSPSLFSFKTPYSCKLYEQMGTDRTEGVGLDSQSKQALREVGAVCVPSHPRSQCFDRRLKQRACRRVTAPSVEDVKRRRRSFDCFSQGRPASRLLHRGWKPSSPVWARKPAICSVKAAAKKQKFTQNEN